MRTYAGAEIWGADAVVHIPNGAGLGSKKLLTTVFAASNAKGSMNGTFYQDLQSDLASTPATMLTNVQGQKALQSMITSYQHKVGAAVAAKDQQAKLIVFMDKAGKANWAYLVSFSVDAVKDGELPAKPAYIVDAKTFAVYASWDNIKTITEEVGHVTVGGGFGGNKKMGKLIYDGLPLDNHYRKLRVTRDDTTGICSMQNQDVTVRNIKDGNVMTYSCPTPDEDYNDVYWNADIDAVNDGYSPMNDALFGGAIIKAMYQKWYGVPVLTKDGQPMMLTMVVHARMDNAYWDGSKMTFGDGINVFYPLTSLGVAAHEISHGFTQQHSNLAYYGMSGGMNEAYSDMAAQAAEYYAYNGKNSWQIGPEIFKQEGRALRYMDQPSKDCNGKAPGNWCSIDSADQYHDGIDVHHSSGVFNHAYYVLGTTTGWDAKKAFDVMVHANQNYWTQNSTFEQGACGVLKAAQDKGYDLDAVKNAFTTVKVDVSNCNLS